MPVKAKEKKVTEKYYQGVGRRKTSTCTVRIYEKKGGGITINEKTLEEYFPTFDLQKTVKQPLEELNYTDKFSATVKINGGGVKSQAEAVRHGIARALVLFDEGLRKQVKSAGYLTRDPRMRERKKPGLKRARRAPQWRKR
jgi:small subunit ribosomal protein S9